jgi:hypothetical protein
VNKSKRLTESVKKLLEWSYKVGTPLKVDKPKPKKDEKDKTDKPLATAENPITP